jgi:hypothetical protein
VNHALKLPNWPMPPTQTGSPCICKDRCRTPLRQPCNRSPDALAERSTCLAPPALAADPSCSPDAGRSDRPPALRRCLCDVIARGCGSRGGSAVGHRGSGHVVTEEPAPQPAWAPACAEVCWQFRLRRYRFGDEDVRAVRVNRMMRPASGTAACQSNGIYRRDRNRSMACVRAAAAPC